MSFYFVIHLMYRYGNLIMCPHCDRVFSIGEGWISLGDTEARHVYD